MQKLVMPQQIPHWPTEHDWHIQLRQFRGRKPWAAFITHGITKLGEPGSGTYASRTPEDALEKALKVVAKLAPQHHPRRITVEVDVTPDGGW